MSKLSLYEAQKLIGTFPKELRTIVWNAKDIQLTAGTGYFCLDPIILDEELAKNDSEYDNVNCTYKGQESSLADYLDLKYGKTISNQIQSLI